MHDPIALLEEGQLPKSGLEGQGFPVLFPMSHQIVVEEISSMMVQLASLDFQKSEFF